MRKNVKKVIAIGLSGMLTAGLIAGNVEYASHTFCLTGSVAQAAAGQKTSSEKVGINQAAGLDKDSEVSKQETVYVNLDASGNQKDVVVSDWLKNSGTNGSLKDVSDLKDIQNVKGDETFQQDGSNVTWNTSNQDIYYQGKTDKELPVGMQITYKLDGKEVKPADIIGKSGKLEMTIKYSNNAKKTVKIGGKETEIYTPFLMATGMILPVDTFDHLTIDNGTIVSEGDNNIVVAYGMPGLKESLDLDNLDFGDDMDIDTSKISDKITDTVKITADVKDFEVNASYTVATNSIFNELDFDDIDDMDELNDKIDELTDSAQKLVDGTKDLQDGTQKLKDNFAKYADAIDTVKDGVSDLKDGSDTLKSGVKDYTKGADKLLTGVNTYVKGSKKLSKGIQAYTAGADQLVSAVNQLRTATKDLPTQYQKFGSGVDTYVASVDKLLAKENMDTMTSGTAALKSGVGQLDDGLKQAQAGVKTINETVNKLAKTDQLDQCVAGLQSMSTQFTAIAEQYKAAGDTENATKYASMVTALQGAVQYIEGGEQVAAGIDAATNGKADGDADKNGAADLAAALATMEAATNKESKETNLYTGAAALDTAAGTMSTYAQQLRDSSGTLTAANKQMSDGVTKVADSIGQIDDASAKLTANDKALNDGAKSLIKNSSAITKNSKKLTKNSSTLRDGASELADGVGTLFDGVSKLVTKTGDVSDGISDLNDGAKELKDGMAKFYKEGIRKIADTVTDLLDTTSDLNDRISKISSTSNDYTSFSGAADDMDGSVKFIMATEELSKDE